MNKKRTNGAILLLFTGLFFAASCTSSQQFVQPGLTQRVAGSPEYLANLSLNGPARSMAISPKSAEPSGLELPKGIAGIQAKYASLLGVHAETICNTGLYRFIDEWYGVRYRFGGTTKSGIDCSAFMQKIYESVFSVNLLRTAVAQASMAKAIFQAEDCKEGDLVFFNTRGVNVSHVGMYLVNRYFVHASSSHGIMISSLDDSYWKKRFTGAGRIL